MSKKSWESFMTEPDPAQYKLKISLKEFDKNNYLQKIKNAVLRHSASHDPARFSSQKETDNGKAK